MSKRRFLIALPFTLILVFLYLYIFDFISLSGGSIDEKLHIPTADTGLYAEIRGRDSGAPVLLYLHGGPANPFGILTFMAYSGPLLEKRFIVVYLQQRGIMRSARVPDNTHTLENYVSDVDHVVRYLKERFAGRDIHVLGHSWGGMLAYLYLLEHEGDVRKLVAACAPLGVEDIMRARYDMTLEWAKVTGNGEAVEELSGLDLSRITEDIGQFSILGKWSSKAYGGMMRNVSQKRIDEATEDEQMIGQWLQESGGVGDIMFAELMSVNLTEKVKGLSTPLLVIAGEEDADSPWRVLEREMEDYGGDKRFLLLEKSHHLVYVDREEEFTEAVVEFLTEDTDR